MDGILSGWRLRSRSESSKPSRNEKKDKVQAPQQTIEPVGSAEQASKTIGQNKAPGEDSQQNGSKLKSKANSNTHSTVKKNTKTNTKEKQDRSDQPDTLESANQNRSLEMRLSKNNPSKEESFEIPSEPVVPSSYSSSPSSSRSSLESTSTPSAVIGPKITFKGELSGEEDLLIQGRVEGTVDLKGHNLTVGKQGIVKANLVAKSIVIEGTVEGDLMGQERISIKASSNVKGNLIADRVTLEDGAKFRGSIDMESKNGGGTSSSYSSKSAATEKATS